MMKLFFKLTERKSQEEKKEKEKNVKNKPIIVVASNACTEFVLICLDKVVGNKDPWEFEKSQQKNVCFKTEQNV